MRLFEKRSALLLFSILVLCSAAFGQLSQAGVKSQDATATSHPSLSNTCGPWSITGIAASATCALPASGVAWSSITAATANTSIATGPFSTTFTEGDFGQYPVGSAFEITDTSTSSTDASTDFTITVPPKSYHQALNVSVDGFTQLQVCNFGPTHVGETLIGNAVACSTLSKAPYNKLTITDETGSHTGLAVFNASASESGAMVRLLSATATTGSFNFLTACAGTTAADGLCNGTTVATLAASGAFSVANSVTAPQFCIGSSCITAWTTGGTITGITTASGSGLQGGGKKGTLSLSLTKTCATGQVLEWNGAAWACADPNGSIAITGVIAGKGLTGGGTSGRIRLDLDATKIPQLVGDNLFRGNLIVNGTIASTATAVVIAKVATDGGERQVGLYSVASPENWFEDAGSGQLANGYARIELDPAFSQTVNTSVEYHVFLTPEGDSEGLYVSNKTPQGFEVHEQHGGRSSIAFDYRVMAKRAGCEDVRLGNLTKQVE
jgi:hypothetical protein